MSDLVSIPAVNEYAKDNPLELISKLNPGITQIHRTNEDEFEFNKDAGIYVCKASHTAIQKVRVGKNKYRGKIKVKPIILISLKLEMGGKSPDK